MNWHPSPLRIIAEVEALWGLPEGEVLSRSQRRSAAAARRVAIWLCDRLTRLSCREIADVFGRDPSRVFGARSEVDARRRVDADLQRDIDTLVYQLGVPDWTEAARQAAVAGEILARLVQQQPAALYAGLSETIRAPSVAPRLAALVGEIAAQVESTA